MDGDEIIGNWVEESNSENLKKKLLECVCHS